MLNKSVLNICHSHQLNTVKQGTVKNSKSLFFPVCRTVGHVYKWRKGHQRNEDNTLEKAELSHRMWILIIEETTQHSRGLRPSLIEPATSERCSFSLLLLSLTHTHPCPTALLSTPWAELTPPSPPTPGLAPSHPLRRRVGVRWRGGKLRAAAGDCDVRAQQPGREPAWRSQILRGLRGRWERGPGRQHEDRHGALWGRRRHRLGTSLTSNWCNRWLYCHC